jgi:hypothetical protein
VEALLQLNNSYIHDHFVSCSSARTSSVGSSEAC